MVAGASDERDWCIRADDLTDPAVLALLDLHHRTAHAQSPAGQAFALDVQALRHSAFALWSAWTDATLLGIAALRDLGDGTGELKSMRTAPNQLRRGVARALLAYVIAEARGRGYRALLLETGGNDAFAPARALYERAGFRRCAPFGDYVESDFNWCYALPL